MQLFRLYPEHERNVRAYPDKYTYNQIRECGTFMSLAVWKEGGDIPDDPATRYENHPITVWAQESLANWLDALAMMEACNQEWIHRYGHDRDRVHGSLETLREVKQEAIRVLPRTGYTLQPCVFPDEFAVHPEPTTIQDVCINYRNYVKEAKADLDWFVYEKNRPKPDFLSRVEG